MCLPHAFDCSFFARSCAWGAVSFGFAWGAGVLDFFALFLFDDGDGFVFKIYENGFQLHRFGGASFNAFATTITFVAIDADIVFTRAVTVTVISNHSQPFCAFS